MTFTPVEIIALIFILVSLIKIIVISINPQSWYNNIVKKIYKPSKLTPWIFLILALIVLYYLRQELTIVQILAVMLFTSLIIGVGFMTYSQDLMKVIDKIFKQKNLLRRAWFYTLIWIILMLWGLKELFF